MRLFSTVCKELSTPGLGFIAPAPSQAPAREAPRGPRGTWAPWSVAAALAVGLGLVAAAPHAPQDQVDRQQLLRQASAGSARAQLQLGLAYHDGRFGLAADAQTAAAWIERAAKAGNVQAETLLGDFYAAGDGVGVDQDEAINWWRQAARAGDPRAASKLGRALMTRADNDAARDAARRWLAVAAIAGDSEARHALGIDTPRTGTAPLNTASPAVTATDRAAQSLYQLVQESSPTSQSIDALKQRARDGDSVAEFQLAMRYRDGAWGVSADPHLALSWLRQAAEHGNPVAMGTLAEAYEKGSLGLSPSADQAAYWRQRAAQAAAEVR